MKTLLTTLCLTIAVFLGSVGVSFSTDFQKGLTAARNGNYVTALREWKPLADQGNASAQYSLGVMYDKGHGVPQDDKTAVKWWKLAAKQGHTGAQYNLGLMYANGNGVSQDDKTAVKWWTLSAEEGFANARNNLGNMYEKGRGVPQDYKIAVTWWTLAAEQGNANAQLSLGLMYRDGQGVPKDYKTAAKWHRLAAEQGDAVAQTSMGFMYEKGRGVPQDYKIAVKWYTLAAKQGFAKSQNNLGNMYRDGKGVPQDYKTALKWYRLAAEQGYAIGQSNLSGMYYNGQGVPKDYKTAVKWSRLAAEQGNARAKNNLSILQKEIAKTKNTPTVTERKPSPPSPSAAEIEVQRLQREVARLKKENKSKPQQVAKKTPQPTPEPKTSTSGSGFFVSKLGHVITNEHVVKDCKSVTVGDNANKQVTANVVETDVRNDLALLKISSMEMASANTKTLVAKLGVKIVPLASQGLLRSDNVELGEDVVVAGFPFADIFSNTIKITKGVVSAKRGMGNDSGQFQIDAAVQKGSSGGPIYDEKGNIIGVVVSQLDRLKVAKAIGSLPENVNFGIKASTVKQFLNLSGLPSSWSKRSKNISTKEIAKIAENQTVMVMCHQ